MKKATEKDFRFVAALRRRPVHPFVLMLMDKKTAKVFSRLAGRRRK